MRILITIQHPAHVHFFRHSVDELESDGHEVRVLAREKEMAVELMEYYNIEHEVVAGESNTLLSLGRTQAKYEWNILNTAWKFEPDIMTAIAEPGIAHASSLIDANSVLFTDTEHATISNILSFPFADRICTPECYRDSIGSKQISYAGYHELAYLHPNRFEPDPSVLDDVGLGPEERFVILRLVGWNAAHDQGDSGFKDIEDVVTAIENKGVKVIITAEDTVPEALDHCQISIEPHRIHDLMCYADLFIGESATMASESAVLGTPAIYVSSIRLGYLNELEKVYRLVFNHSGPNRQNSGLEKALSILENYDKQLWMRRQKEMLKDKIDTTEFIINQIQHNHECS